MTQRQSLQRWHSKQSSTGCSALRHAKYLAISFISHFISLLNNIKITFLTLFSHLVITTIQSKYNCYLIYHSEGCWLVLFVLIVDQTNSPEGCWLVLFVLIVDQTNSPEGCWLVLFVLIVDQTNSPEGCWLVLFVLIVDQTNSPEGCWLVLFVLIVDQTNTPEGCWLVLFVLIVDQTNNKKHIYCQH